MNPAPAKWICFLLLATLNAIGQRLANLKLTEAGSAVLVRFTVTRGSDCGGYKILHSLDSVNFELIADEPGICGKTDEDETKSFTHMHPAIGQRNYYRVQLYNLELSDIRGLYLFPNLLSAWCVYPSPVSGASGRLMLKWSPLEGVDNWVGSIYDAQGRQVRKLNLTYLLPNQEIAGIEGLQAGMYKLWLTGGAYKINLDFIVQ